MNKLNIIKLFLYMISTVTCFSLCFVVKGLALSNITREFKNPIFELDYMINTGASFSIFQNSSYILGGAALAFLFGILFYICYNSHKINYYKIILLAIFSAGIASNLFERLRYGFVTDYISIKLFRFPIFNFQDILIVVTGVLLVLTYQLNSKKKNEEPAMTQECLQDEHNE